MGNAPANKERPKGVGAVRGRNRVTMHDIARVAGCSQPTVSFVLNRNNGAKISEATKQRIFDAAQSLGYVHKDRKEVGSLRLVNEKQDRERPIAFVVDNLATSPETVHAFDGVMEAVRARGNLVLLSETGNDRNLEPKTLRYFLESGVAAIVYACVFTRQVELPALLHDADVPVFLLNCYTDPPSYPAVVPSEIAGGHVATNALLRAGHSRIGIITGEMFMEAAEDRMQGYRNALSSSDLPVDEDLIFEGNWLPSSGYDGTRKLMSLAKPPTAIFCQNDRMAVGCYEALKELGLSIPEDISVIGYDDDELARHLSPPLTSMNLASRSLGRWVIEQLFNGPSGPADSLLTKLECELVERDSIAPPHSKSHSNGELGDD